MSRGIIWTFVFTTPNPTCSVSNSSENNSIHVIIHKATVDITEITISVVNQHWKDKKVLNVPTLFSPGVEFFRVFNSFWCNLQDVNAKLRLDTITDKTVKGTERMKKQFVNVWVFQWRNIIWRNKDYCNCMELNLHISLKKSSASLPAMRVAPPIITKRTMKYIWITICKKDSEPVWIECNCNAWSSMSCVSIDTVFIIPLLPISISEPFLLSMFSFILCTRSVNNLTSAWT